MRRKVSQAFLNASHCKKFENHWNNRSAQSSNFRRTPANTNAVAADREKSDDPSKDYVFILGSLSQGNPNDSVTLNVGGIELYDFLIDSVLRVM